MAYKIKINSHGVVLIQRSSNEIEPVHGSVDSEGFTWLESSYPVNAHSEYWNGTSWESCGPKPFPWSIWENGGWVESIEIKEHIQGEIAIRIRKARNTLLASSDWTQLSDTALSDEKKAEWTAYRQTLRDFPAANNPATTDIDTVVWPTPPEL